MRLAIGSIHKVHGGQLYKRTSLESSLNSLFDLHFHCVISSWDLVKPKNAVNSDSILKVSYFQFVVCLQKTPTRWRCNEREIWIMDHATQSALFKLINFSFIISPACWCICKQTTHVPRLTSQQTTHIQSLTVNSLHQDGRVPRAQASHCCESDSGPGPYSNLISVWLWELFLGHSLPKKTDHPLRNDLIRLPICNLLN